MNHKPRGCETVLPGLLHWPDEPAASKRRRLTLRSDAGAVTAEYAIATMAAVAFAGLLVLIMRSDEVRTLLFNLVSSALSVEL